MYPYGQPAAPNYYSQQPVAPYGYAQPMPGQQYALPMSGQAPGGSYYGMPMQPMQQMQVMVPVSGGMVPVQMMMPVAAPATATAPAGGAGSFSVWSAQFYSQISQQEMQEFSVWFKAVDKDNSGTITSAELSLLAFGNKPIGLETAKKLIAVFDRDHNGSINFQEYSAMHKFLTCMQQAFFNADKDKNGLLDTQEVHQALSSTGFQVQLTAVRAMYIKCTMGKSAMDFVSFISMVLSMALMRSKFDRSNPSTDGRITLSFEQLVEFIGETA